LPLHSLYGIMATGAGITPIISRRAPIYHFREAKMPLRYILLTLSLIAVCAGAPARAAVYFVSDTGSDTAACSYVAPCQTLAVGVAKAGVADSVVCVGTVATTALAITKSIDIDCSAGRAIFKDEYAGNAAITINIPVGAVDPLRTVRLRGLSIMGAANSGSGRFIPRGVEIQAATAVYVEDVSISDTAQQGILDQRTGGQTRLYVANSIIRNCGGPGIVAASAATAITVLDNVRSENNSFGLAVAAGNNVTVSRSVLSGNSNAGVEGDGGAQIIVDNSTISHNGIGVQSASSVRISNNNIAFNVTAISGATGTFGNNRFSGNTSMGTAPTPLGGASSDFAQQ